MDHRTDLRPSLRVPHIAATATSERAGGTRLGSTRSLDVVALQRSVGNAAVARLMAPVLQRKTDPATFLPDPSTAAPKPFQPPAARLSANPDLQDVLFPFRRQMLEKFVAMYQSVELDSLDPAAREASFAKMIGEVHDQQAKLASLPKQTQVDKQRAAQLERTLKGLEGSASQRLATAKQWRSINAPPGQSIAALEAEVTRLSNEVGLPAWAATAVLEFGGMRYGRTDSGGKQTAHGSYASPQRLLWLLARARNPGMSIAEQKGFSTLSTSEALGRLKAMREGGTIPEWAWRRVVYQTDLRLDPANTDESWNRPPGAPIPEKGKAASESDSAWLTILNEWIAGIAPMPGSSVYGTTAWRAEMLERSKSRIAGYSANVMLGVVCNELSEAIMADAGTPLSPVGGIGNNANIFALDPKDAQKAAPGMYFGRVQAAKVHPGSVVFQMHEKWGGQRVDASARVSQLASVTFPQPTVDPDPSKDDPSTTPPEGIAWTTIVTPGQPIRRETTADPHLTQYAIWRHQMTVVETRGTNVVVLETGTTGAGVYTHAMSSLEANERMFLGARESVITLPEITIVGDPSKAGDPD